MEMTDYCHFVCFSQYLLIQKLRPDIVFNTPLSSYSLQAASPSCCV